MRKLFLLLALLLTMSVSAQPKREFRGAWIQCVNGQFQGMGTQKMQQTLLYQLDELQKDGVNAIILEPFSDWSARQGAVALLGPSAMDD